MRQKVRKSGDLLKSERVGESDGDGDGWRVKVSRDGLY